MMRCTFVSKKKQNSHSKIVFVFVTRNSCLPFLIFDLHFQLGCAQLTFSQRFRHWRRSWSVWSFPFSFFLKEVTKFKKPYPVAVRQFLFLPPLTKLTFFSAVRRTLQHFDLSPLVAPVVALQGVF